MLDSDCGKYRAQIAANLVYPQYRCTHHANDHPNLVIPLRSPVHRSPYPTGRSPRCQGWSAPSWHRTERPFLSPQTAHFARRPQRCSTSVRPSVRHSNHRTIPTPPQSVCTRPNQQTPANQPRSSTILTSTSVFVHSCDGACSHPHIVPTVLSSHPRSPIVPRRQSPCPGMAADPAFGGKGTFVHRAST
jgi:hypothetical protein